MLAPARHVRHQGRVLVSLGATVIDAARKRVGLRPPQSAVVPGAELVASVPAPPAALVRDYVRFVGGDPAAYRGLLPPHLFPQWSFPVAARTLRGLPYSLLAVMNAGCRLEVKAPLPAAEPLVVRAALVSVEDDGRRALLHQRVVTGTERVPEAVIADLFAVVPSQSAAVDRPPSGRSAPRVAARVPAAARELGFWRLPAGSGLRYAFFTGDFNPVHWAGPYARAFGHRAPILHGFCTLARTWEGLGRGLHSGDSQRLRCLDVRFTRALVLPARVGLHVHEKTVAVGDAPGGPAYLLGSFSEGPPT